MIIPAAMVTPQPISLRSRNKLDPTVSVYMSWLLRSTRAIVKSLQATANAKIAAEIYPGLAIGRTTSHTVRNRPAPAIHAFSS